MCLLSILFFLIDFIFLFPQINSLDVFCGNLTVYEQQRFGLNSFLISSQSTDDLKQCLELCCNIPNCQGVTLLGIITPSPGEANCQLWGCRGGDCLISPRGNDGLISVILTRDRRDHLRSTQSNSLGMDSEGHLIGGSTTDRPTYTTAASITIPEFFENSPHQQGTNSISLPPFYPSPSQANDLSDHNNHEKMSKALQPVWAVGLAIVIAVCCVGLSLGLLSAYICYRRQKNRKQRAEITQPKMPTLHAFNTAY